MSDHHFRPTPAEPPTRTRPLDVESILDAAERIVRRQGLAGLSMRKLGNELAVDPMAIYHYVDSKRSLLALLTARALGTIEVPDPETPWEAWVRQWAMSYWELVTEHRDLILAGLSDPTVGAGGLTSTRQLIAAIARSGLPKHLVEPSAFLLVDAVHGAALGAASLAEGSAEFAEARRAFVAGIDIVVVGIASRADQT